jgi:hypothetical protein
MVFLVLGTFVYGLTCGSHNILYKSFFCSSICS